MALRNFELSSGLRTGDGYSVHRSLLPFRRVLGWVTIIVLGESVTYANAWALPGWTPELKNSGPEEVKVHFERNDDEEEKIKFKARVEDGELKVDISEDDEHDEDD